MTEEINKGCEFQSDCIEYKDISYLKIMPICAIHELSIACHDKVNKCKYYKLYKQLKRLEQENKELKKAYDEISNNSEILHENHSLRIANAKLSEDLWQHGISMREWKEQSLKYRSALEEIQKVIKSYDLTVDNGASVDTLYTIKNIINEVLQ